ncbi:alpha/beta fold hydrolase [Salinarchaeum laminariae]|uniref:alpha/beta fold hydrolase n=1 Tax=Salinarchaeum laminariae TaxID=869888 RepID=UPI0020C0593E|nr:alpha/beta fold hydrolase [Salinarchaeum laminariae]
MDQSFVSGRSVRDDTVAGRFYPGLGTGPHPAVLVLHGGGGAGGYERNYAALLAEHGYATLCVEYFGASGVPDALAEIPLERFDRAARWLLERDDVAGDRVGVVGFSRGGEAALLTGAQFDAIGPVVSYVPSCYVWPAPAWMEGVDPHQPAWTLDGDPLPFVDVDALVDEEEISDEALEDPLAGEPDAATLAIERASDRELDRAAIPVEAIDGPVLLVSGGKDTVWPASTFADRALARLEAHDHEWSVEHRHYPDAGHAIRVPYRFDSTTSHAETHQYGGTNEANARAAADAWLGALQHLSDGLPATD